MENQVNLRRIIPAFLVAWLLCSIGGQTSRGDLPRPPKPTPQDNPSPAKNDSPQLVIRIDGDGKTARLVIPKSVLNSLTGQARPHADTQFSPASTVVAGFAMTAALVCSGLLLTRGRSRRGTLLLAVALVGGVGIVATIASANLAPFPHERDRPLLDTPLPVITADPLTAHETTIPVIVQSSEDGPIRLTIPTTEAPALVAVQEPATRPSPSFNEAAQGK